VDQPVKEVAAVGPAAGHPLVEVVVGVDEASGDDVTATLQDLVSRLGFHRSDRCYAAVLNCDVTRVPGTSDYQT
jgi:hypothetical protein